MVKIMFSIKSFILLFVLSLNNTNRASVISNGTFNIFRNKSVIKSENEYKQTIQFPSIDPNIDEDARLSVPQLITKYGYKVEVHYVTTEDGYIIALHRIAGGGQSPPRKGKRVAYWMHGLTDSSAGVILNGPGHSLAYLLVDNDYDVWLANARGTMYSLNHTTLDPFGSIKDRDHYWKFSWHEIAVYDASASIDYILAHTGQRKLQCVGHSQGGTVFFVLTSEKPEYNDKIEMMHALAPSVFLSNIIAPGIRAIVPFLPVLERLKELIGAHYITPSKDFRVLSGELLCRDKMPTQIICANLLLLVMGFDSDQLNSTLLPIMMGHTPAGCATNQFIHFGQVINSGHFRKYDFGPEENLLRYKQSIPPDYNLKRVTTSVALYYSQNDWMTTVPDIHILMKKLPNLVKSYLVPHKKFNHLDFLAGTQAPTLLFNEVLKNMNNCQTTSNNSNFTNQNFIV